MSRVLGVIVASLFLFTSVKAQECFPKQDKSNRIMVYDLVDKLSQPEEAALNAKLVNLSNQSSNQFVVVITNDICGKSPNQYTTELGHTWGVGRKGEDNGLIFLVKFPGPNSQQRTTYIAPGYGLEGVIPDATAKLIIENNINPFFKQGDFYKGIDQGVDLLAGLAKGEFDSAQYMKQYGGRSRKGGKFIIFIIVIGIVIASKFMGARRYSQQNGISLWSAFFMGNIIGSSFGGSGRRGGYDDFSSGGGGFGGFGGGGFGGGGAGGDW